jgi:aryl-alcohol dehydrogenase-like predicted oxidoreductase
MLDEEGGRPIIRRALEAGINYLDTADRWSLGQAGSAVAGAARGRS